VVAASNGNHGLGVAAAARARGIAAEVYVSAQRFSPPRRGASPAHGARHPAPPAADPLAAELAARRAAETSGRVFISPYNELDVVAGQGTIAVELHRQIPELDAVFVAVGGGGLIGGIGSYLKSVSPRTENRGLLAREFAGAPRVPARRQGNRGGRTADAFRKHCRRTGTGLGYPCRSARAPSTAPSWYRKRKSAPPCGWFWRPSTG
jgi:threonine dehydratase